MPKTKVKQKKKVEVESYSHKGRRRKNNPHVGLVSSATDKLNGRTKYQHDPHIDPYLSWAGKKEGAEFEVQNVSLHIHERIDPKRIIKAFLKKEKDPTQKQLSLFEESDNDPPLTKAIDFYRHDQDWANRLIAGDSLLVMNSLLKKEGMAGKIQAIFLDPPYGIKYNSNFQPFLSKRDVKDGNDADIPAEPEMIQAFRDTWELGTHSYLTYLRERLFLAKELLHETGSCFVQINDQNLHHVKELMCEIFGENNFIATIIFRKKKMPLGAKFLEYFCDYIVYFSKNIEKLKYRQLFMQKSVEGDSKWCFVELEDGTRRRMTEAEHNKHSLLPKGSKVYLRQLITPAGFNESGLFSVKIGNKVIKPPPGKSWKTSEKGMKNLLKANRIELSEDGKTLNYILKLNDFPVTPLNSLWSDTSGAHNQRYVVETSPDVIQRCLLMATDPGDLVFDPTCGSGTTAFVSEQWGRRWITCDTSRVAITLAKQRLMTAKFDYFELAHEKEGVRSGFKYKTVPHITLGSIANNEPAKEETLYNQPFLDKSKVRVTGPFTVEAVPCLATPNVKPFEGKTPKIEARGDSLARFGETARQTEWRDELKATGIRAVGNKIISFSRVEPMVATRFLHADAEIIEDGVNKRTYISFGPDHGPLEQRQVEEAIKEARGLKEKPDFVVFAAFHFDPEAAKDIDQITWQGVTILKAQMSVDLLTKDLRKKRSASQSYWLIGQPDVTVAKTKDSKFKVTVNGFDYYDPVSGEIISKGTKHIAMWFLDTDYDERSLYPDQVFFPENNPKRDWSKLAKALKGEVNEELLEHFSGVESLPFSAGEQKKIAVKIIDNRGIESFVIKGLS